MVNVWRLMAHYDEYCRLPMIQWQQPTTGLLSAEVL